MRQSLARLLLILSGISILANLIFIYNHVKRTTKKAPRSIHQEARIEIYDSLPLPDSSTIFIGNSITEFFPLNELLPGPLINRGINGDVTKGVIRRIGNIANARAATVFLEIGINDIIKGTSEDSIILNFGEIIEKTRRCNLRIQSILPTNFAYSSYNGKVDRVNDLLRQLCEKQNVIYIDLNSVFKVNGKLDSTVTYDGLHLNSKGYESYANKLSAWLPSIQKKK